MEGLCLLEQVVGESPGVQGIRWEGPENREVDEVASRGRCASSKSARSGAVGMWDSARDMKAGSACPPRDARP